MAETFKLPVSSYEELIKIIQAYASEKEGTQLSLDAISHSTGMDRTLVSGNNGFLVQIGLVTEGNKKASTEIGRSLGRAYSSKIDEEIVRIWKEIIFEIDFLNRMISAVRIRKGMDRSNLLNHIVYSSGLKDSSKSRAGAGAVIEILKVAEILNENDGKLTVNDETSIDASTPKSDNTQNSEDASFSKVPQKYHTIKSQSGVTININITCSVDEVDVLGEKLKSLLDAISE